MAKRKLTIIGASGFVGTHLYRYLVDVHPQYQLMGTYFGPNMNPDLIELDVTETADLERYLAETKPDILIWLAANKSVQWCESHSQEASLLNTQSVSHALTFLGRLCPDCWFIYVSSDYVFNGLSGNYTDRAQPHPVTVYGQTKLESERALSVSTQSWTILRPSAIMGPGGQFWDWLINSLTTNSEVCLFSNVYFTPTPINMFCECMAWLLSLRSAMVGRTLHLCGTERISRYQFGAEVASRMRSHASVIPHQRPADMFIPPDLSLVVSQDFRKRICRSMIDYLKEFIL